MQDCAIAHPQFDAKGDAILTYDCQQGERKESPKRTSTHPRGTCRTKGGTMRPLCVLDDGLLYVTLPRCLADHRCRHRPSLSKRKWPWPLLRGKQDEGFTKRKCYWRNLLQTNGSDNVKRKDSWRKLSIANDRWNMLKRSNRRKNVTNWEHAIPFWLGNNPVVLK